MHHTRQSYVFVHLGLHHRHRLPHHLPDRHHHHHQRRQLPNEKMFADNNDETSIERVTRAVEKTTSKLKNHQGPE